MSVSMRTTCQPCRQAWLICLRMSSGSVVNKPEVELLSEYGANREAPQDPKAPMNHQCQRVTKSLQNAPSIKSLTPLMLNFPFFP